jgi:regulator of RNase E activity RraB
MEQQWIGHMMEGDETALSCLIDVGLAEVAPDASRPLLTMARIAFKDPLEHGFGSEEEREVLGGFEDAMEERAEKLKAVHGASVRGNGVLDVLFYSPAKAGEAMERMVQEVCRGYEVEVGSGEDPEWEQYENLFPPHEAIMAYQDMQLIMVLQGEGDRADQSRPVDHMLYLPTPQAADTAVKRLRGAGYEETERSETKGEELPVGLQLTRRHNVEPGTIAAARAELTALAEDLGGEYDGWQTPLVK